MLFDKPHQRYIIYLSETPTLIKENSNFKYFLHVIDHYSKFLFGELLTNKNANNIIKNYLIFFIQLDSLNKYVLIMGKNFLIKYILNF